MPYVERLNGKIVGVYENPQKGFAEEFLPADNPEVVSFNSPKLSKQEKLKQIITAAQDAMKGNPLPDEILLSICQLEAACDVAFARGYEGAVVAAIQSFSIPDNAEISQSQRDAVVEFKTQMLQMLLEDK